MANNLVNLPAALPNREQVLARAAEAKPLEIKALHADLLALAQPASRRDIGEHLAILIACFPNAKTDDTEIFGRMMAEDVLSTQPSLSDVEVTCRRLRQTRDFRPSIHEVLEALDAAKRHRLMWADRIKYLVEHPEPYRLPWQSNNQNRDKQIARAKAIQAAEGKMQ